MAASANLPVIVLSIFWKRFNTAGAVCGLAVGLLSHRPDHGQPQHHGDRCRHRRQARHLIQGAPLFPLKNPGILSIPLGFLAAILGTLLSHDPAAADKFDELTVRANTGLGAEKASEH